MLKFNDFETLQNFLQEDRDKASFSPIRFINVESIEMWLKVKKLLQSMVSCNFLLSTFCEDEDTTPNIKRLKTQLKDQTQHVCIFPLSESLRVTPETAKSVIIDFLSSEYNDSIDNHYRIYLPMYRMKSVLQSINFNDPRKEECIILLETGEGIDTAEEYSLTIIQNNLQIDVGENSITGFKHYLEYWEENPDTSVTLHTKNAIYFEQNLFFDNVRVIVTSYDLLKFYYDLPSDFKRENGTTEQWDKLTETMVVEKKFSNACCAVFESYRYDRSLFKKWNQFNNYKKWLLWMWTRTQNQASYLTDCAKEANSEEEFVNALFFDIVPLINAPNYENLYQERKELLKNMGVSVPDAFLRAISKYGLIDKLKMLTDTTIKERESIFSCLKGVDYSSSKPVIKVLRTTYPLLANYLSCEGDVTDGVFSDLHREYFDEYRWGKVTDSLSEHFYNQVSDIARTNGESVFALNARNAIVAEEYINPGTTIMFIDGMGAEYIDLIAYVLSELDQSQYLLSYQVGSCVLPSTTEFNKNFLEGKNVALETRDLDDLKHGAKYYPDNIVAELDFIATLKEKVLDAFTDGINRVILTSDHGTSRLAVLARQTQFDNKISAEGHSIYRYGRYCVGTDLSLETAIEYGGDLIFADYSRFEQKGAPIDEIHGGASLEEWLVPVVIIQRENGNTVSESPKIHANIVLLNDPVQKDHNTQMITVQFKISNLSISSMVVSIHGKAISCQKFEDVFQFRYKPSTGETSITVQLQSEIAEGSFTVKIKSGLELNKEFDI